MSLSERLLVRRKFGLAVLIGGLLLAGSCLSIELNPVRILFGPTVDDFGDRADKSADRAAKLLEAILKKNVDIAVVDLSQALEETRTAVREERATLVKDLYERAKAQTRALKFYGGELGSDIGSKVQTSVFYLVLSLVFLTLLICAVFIFTRPIRHKTGLLSALVGVGVLVVVMAIPIHKRIDVCEAFRPKFDGAVQSYWQEFARRNFVSAQARAEALSEVNLQCSYSNSSLWNLRGMANAYLVRIFNDVLDLDSTDLKQIEIVIASAADRAPDVESNLRAALAMQAWRVGSARTDELKSALIAVDSLKSLTNDGTATPDTFLVGQDQRNWGYWFPLAPLALHYLHAYTTRPLSDRQLAAVNMQGSESLAKLRSIEAAVRKKVRGNPNAELAIYNVDAYDRYAELTATKFRRIHTNYVCMLTANIGASLSANVEVVARLQKARDDFAARLLSEYDDKKSGFSIAILDETYDRTGMRMTAALSGHAMYVRASQYVGYGIVPLTAAISNLKMVAPLMAGEIDDELSSSTLLRVTSYHDQTDDSQIGFIRVGLVDDIKKGLDNTVGKILPRPPGPGFKAAPGAPPQPIPLIPAGAVLEKSPAFLMTDSMKSSDAGDFTKKRMKVVLVDTIRKQLDGLIVFEKAFREFHRLLALKNQTEVSRLAAFQALTAAAATVGIVVDSRPGVCDMTLADDANSLTTQPFAEFLASDIAQMVKGASDPVALNSEQSAKAPLWIVP